MTTAVDLRPHHVPAVIREPLEAHTAAVAEANSLHQRLAYAPPSAERADLERQYEEAKTAAETTRLALATATVENAPGMQAAAGNAFAAAIERARGHIAAAQTELRDAAGAAALFAQIKPGRATINASSERAARSNARGACMRAAGELRNLEMPEDVDD